MIIWMSEDLVEVDEVKVRNKDAVEKISAIIHMSWCDWASTVIDAESINKDLWKEYFVPYEQLDEEIKELNRIWARRILHAIQK